MKCSNIIFCNFNRSFQFNIQVCGCIGDFIFGNCKFSKGYTIKLFSIFLYSRITILTYILKYGRYFFLQLPVIKSRPLQNILPCIANQSLPTDCLRSNVQDIYSSGSIIWVNTTWGMNDGGNTGAFIFSSSYPFASGFMGSNF